MFLPFRDSPNPPGTPFVTWTLIAINVAIFVFVSLPLGATPVDPENPALQEIFARDPDLLRGVQSAYDVLVMQFGYTPSVGGVVPLFTAMFLHGGLMHLVGNMLFLWIYGDNVEARLGHGLFLGAYLLTGVAATMGHALLDLSSTIPTIGASGAISGVLGFYFVFFPKNVVHILLLLPPFFVTTVSIPARVVLGFYLVIDNLLPFFAKGPAAGGVAYGAHIGGFVAGVALAFVAQLRPDGVRPSPTAPTKPRVVPTNALDRTLVNLVRKGDYARAAQLYFSERTAGGDELHLPTPYGLELAQWLAENGHPTAALQVFKRMIAQSPTGHDGAWAHVGAGYVQERHLGRLPTAYQHYLDAIDLDPSGEAGARAREGVARIDAAT